MRAYNIPPFSSASNSFDLFLRLFAIVLLLPLLPPSPPLDPPTPVVVALIKCCARLVRFALAPLARSPSLHLHGRLLEAAREDIALMNLSRESCGEGGGTRWQPDNVGVSLDQFLETRNATRTVNRNGRNCRCVCAASFGLDWWLLLSLYNGGGWFEKVNCFGELTRWSTSLSGCKWHILINSVSLKISKRYCIWEWNDWKHRRVSFVASELSWIGGFAVLMDDRRRDRFVERVYDVPRRVGGRM